MSHRCHHTGGYISLQLLSRRSFNDAPLPTPNLATDRKNSPWCSVAIACRRTLSPVCGFDDNFGYGKFDDICHMLQVNCYWKYSKFLLYLVYVL